MYNWVVLFFYRSHISFQKHIFYTVNITFSEVKMEDYGHPFICHAGVSAAYFVLKLPGSCSVGYMLFGGLKTMTRRHMWKQHGIKHLAWGSRVTVEKLSIHFLFGNVMVLNSFPEQRISTLLNVMNDQLKNFWPSLLSTYQGLYESHKYCTTWSSYHDHYSTKIHEVYTLQIPRHGSSQREGWRCCSKSWGRTKRSGGWMGRADLSNRS